MCTCVLHSIISIIHMLCYRKSSKCYNTLVGVTDQGLVKALVSSFDIDNSSMEGEGGRRVWDSGV